MASSDELSPATQLHELASSVELSVSDIGFARHLDAQDPLKKERAKFVYPKKRNLPGGKMFLKGLKAEYACLNSALSLCGDH